MTRTNEQIPLPLAPNHQLLQVISIKGNPETIKRLSSMGISPNVTIQITHYDEGNLIVGINNSRIAIAYSLAQRIIVNPINTVQETTQCALSAI